MSSWLERNQRCFDGIEEDINFVLLKVVVFRTLKCCVVLCLIYGDVIEVQERHRLV